MTKYYISCFYLNFQKKKLKFSSYYLLVNRKYIMYIKILLTKTSILLQKRIDLLHIQVTKKH